MSINLPIIQELSLQEPKTLLERFAKLGEEAGELAQEILIAEQASGFQHKTKSEDGIAGEAVDVLIVAFSIYFKNGGTIAELGEILDKKCEKWKKWQRKPA